MPIDLGDMTLGELQKLGTQIERELNKRDKQQISKAKKALAALARQHGLSLEEVMGTGGGDTPPRKRRGKGKPKAKGVAKYRNPEDASQTWTGKGRPPAWILAARDAGVSEKKLLIQS